MKATPGSLGQAPTRVDIATAALRVEILCGHLPPGTRIHLQEASQRLHMSPGPIREALRTLAGEGLVVGLPQRGYRVRPLSRVEFDDLYRWRLELDPKAAYEAAVRLTDDQLEEMRATLATWSSAFRHKSWDEYHVYHRKFHILPYEACGSAWLRDATVSLWDASVRYQALIVRMRSQREHIAEHHDVLEAFLTRDADRAAEAATKLLQDTIDSINALDDDVLS